VTLPPESVEPYSEGTKVRVWWARAQDFDAPEPPAGLEEGAVGTILGEYDGAFYEEDFDPEGRAVYEVEFPNYHEGKPGKFLVWHRQMEVVP
jgi:hypothetical protein